MSPSSENEDQLQLQMAAEALGQLRNQSSRSPECISMCPEDKTKDTNIVNCINDNDESRNKTTILDKVTSYPLISSSISYMLEKTINTSNNYVMEEPRVEDQDSGKVVQDIRLDEYENNKRKRFHNEANTVKASSIIIPGATATTTVPPTSLTTKVVTNNEIIFKKPKLETHSNSTSYLSSLAHHSIHASRNQTHQLLPPLNAIQMGSMNQSLPQQQRFSRSNPNLRQQVTISSAVSAQRSLQDLKELSVLNLNIESRKRLTMLINFLKIGNRQLSERIENLIEVVEKERDKTSAVRSNAPSSPYGNGAENYPGSYSNHRHPTDRSDRSFLTSSTSSLSSLTAVNSTTSLRSLPDTDHKSDDGSTSCHANSNAGGDFEIPIQQLKNEIIGTVKKIVNVVSKVSANSLPEPARSNVREMLLKLPANWALLIEQQQQMSGQDRIPDSNHNDLASSGSDSEGDDYDNEDEDMDGAYSGGDSDTGSIGTEYEDSLEYQSKSSTSPKNEARRSPLLSSRSQHIQPKKRRSIAHQLLRNLFKYGNVSRSSSQIIQRRRLSTASNSSTSSSNQPKSWFKKTIRDQILNDPNGKVLILAQESLDIINKVIKFCNQNLDKAENWNMKLQSQTQFDLINKLQGMTYVCPVKSRDSRQEEQEHDDTSDGTANAEINREVETIVVRQE